MKHTGLMLGLCLFAGAALAADPGNWKPLFNGKDLKGWSAHYASKTPDGAPAASTIFKVENGVIHAYATHALGTSPPTAYLVTDNAYQDYVLSLEYQWGEKKFEPRLNLVRD